MTSRNLTVTLPADLVRRATIVAAMRDTSISALIADHLRALTEQDDGYDVAWQQERDLMCAGLDMQVGSISWSRDEAHQRCRRARVPRHDHPAARLRRSAGDRHER